MKKKLFSLIIVLLVGLSAWADDIWDYSVYESCAYNGYLAGYVPSPTNVQAVDLGLPSGIKWASCNIGAKKPEDYGNYYAWGEVFPKEKYSWSTYKYANSSENTLTKYCNDSTHGNNGFKDNKIVLDIEDDAAHVNWGGNWRMPTDAEWEELLGNCTWTWTTQNGVNGYLVTSKTNSNSIFLPAAGYRDSENSYARPLYNYYDGAYGCYWSASLSENYTGRAWLRFFNNSGIQSENCYARSYGLSIRPVCSSYSSPSLSNNFVTLTLYAENCEDPSVIKCDAGQQVRIHAYGIGEEEGVAYPSSHFAQWNDWNTDNPRLVTITKDTTLIAEFDDYYHTISTAVNDTTRGRAEGATTTSVPGCGTLTAIANYGYHFAYWKSPYQWYPWNYNEFEGDTIYTYDNPCTVCGYDDVTYIAVFEKNIYTITAQSSDKTKGYVSAPSQAEYLDQVTLTATANSDCYLSQWSDGVTDNPRTIVLTCDTTLTAEFAYAPYLTLVADEKGIVSGAGYFHPNTSCEISATANYGYHFTQWSDGNIDNPRTIVITSDTTFTAEFAANQYTISTADTDMGIVEGATTTDYLNYVTLTATANYGYYFAYWWNDNHYLYANPLTVKVTGDDTYTAVFEKNAYSITAQSVNIVQGSVSAPSWSEYLDQVTLTATANLGYSFAQWSDGNTDNPRTIILTCDTNFLAEFAQTTFSGQCGDSLYWSYAGHTLTISGTGEMYDYSCDDYYSCDLPWLLLRDSITEVVLERGITHIGTYAFNGFVKLRKIELPNTLTSIGANAFAGCRKLYNVYSYAVEPPIADNTSFANYNVYLYVPCDNLFEYQLDALFGSFKYIQCLGAENTTTEGNVTVTPSDDEAVFVWPADGSANTYTLQISKDGTVFCTLIFNANGQLNSIAFAPARNGQKHQAAEQIGSGFRFTVTGLSESTHYTFDMTVKDSNDATLQTYTGVFNTTGQGGTATSVNNTTIDTTPSKIFRNGQVYILRGEKTYTITGDEVK